jgi:hypothetical protein
MNQDIDQLFDAVSVDQLREAIESNPDVNEVSPKYGQIAINYLVNYHKFVLVRIATANGPSHDELIGMIGLLLEAGSETDGLYLDILMSYFPLEVKIRLCRLLLDRGVQYTNEEFYDYYSPEVVRFIKVDYKLEKIRDSFCAAQIQNWFLKKYYDPYHPYGKRRLERIFEDLCRQK